MAIIYQTPEFMVARHAPYWVTFLNRNTREIFDFLDGEAKRFLTECGATPLDVLWDKYS